MSTLGTESNTIGTWLPMFFGTVTCTNIRKAITWLGIEGYIELEKKHQR
jgi:hypothetical protein